MQVEYRPVPIVTVVLTLLKYYYRRQTFRNEEATKEKEEERAIYRRVDRYAEHSEEGEL